MKGKSMDNSTPPWRIAPDPEALNDYYCWESWIKDRITVNTSLYKIWKVTDTRERSQLYSIFLLACEGSKQPALEPKDGE